MKKSVYIMGLVVFLAMVLMAGGLFAQPLIQPGLKREVSIPNAPDLIIDEIYLSKPISDCYVTVVVKNIGLAQVPNFVWTSHNPKSAGVYLYVNGRKWGGASIWKFDTFRKLQTPGGKAVYKSRLKISGSARVTAVVDLWNTIKEKTHGNNSLTKRFDEGDCDFQAPEAI